MDEKTYRRIERRFRLIEGIIALSMVPIAFLAIAGVLWAWMLR